MKKFILVITLTIFILCGCTANQENTIETNTITYKDATFEVPADWEKRDLDNDNLYLYTPNDDFLMMIESELGSQLDESLVDTFLSGLESQDRFSEFEILNKESKTIKNKVYFVADIKCLDSGHPMRYQNVLVEHNLNVYSFIMSSTGDTFLYDDEINLILNSLKFENNSTTEQETQPSISQKKVTDTKTITYGEATFEIPTDWEEQNTEKKRTRTFFTKNNNFLMLDKFEIEIPLDNEFFDIYLNLFNEQYSNFSVKSKDSKTINNKVYFIANANFLKDGYFYSLQLCAAEHNGFLYSFMITAKGNDFLYADELNKLLNSIKFTDNKITSTDKPKTNNSSITNSHTLGEQNALKEAISYLGVSAFSKQGLIEQLEYEGYSLAEATYAVENCGADWNAQAAKSAKQYLDIMSFSRSGLIDQLLHEGFTQEEAAYGVKAVGY